jgi:hypothetical protein
MYATPFDRALRIALDAPSGRPFDRRAVCALFADRASWDTIRHWRRGNAGPPQWAVDIVQTAALAKASLAQQAALAVSAGRGKGHGAGAKALRAWRAKRAKEKADHLAGLLSENRNSD